ncbi:MAG: RimK/LysX family protein [Planctomycetota bacterium]
MRIRSKRSVRDDLAVVGVPMVLLLGAMAVVSWVAPAGPSGRLIADTPEPDVSRLQLTAGEAGLRFVGPTASVAETESGLAYLARVDTGALRTSVHADTWTIESEAGSMHENIGKPISFRLANRRGDEAWVETPITGVVNVRTSEGEETRYLVDLTLNLQGVERTVEVTLNDRSRMTYALLLGRNYLSGAFAVDVSRPESVPHAEEGALLAVGG